MISDRNTLLLVTVLIECDNIRSIHYDSSSYGQQHTVLYVINSFCIAPIFLQKSSDCVI